MVSVSKVTAPLRASTRPETDTSVVTVIDVKAMIVPSKPGPGSERRRAANLPEHVAGLHAVDQADLAGRRRSSARNQPGR